ncbi:Murein DD-endopeptidase MepM and murein hydrolase activator NlpD, contain LysM domain [Oceanospirillum multiglobuliferum]|uniref:LysM domain-containing protein n=1 Tax=Oceanospirillum multiglobuliferum TaxID=64969 RepID=A0A1T4REH4_9GAMM|nr:peptidoglycan DD-metalloendopeptidase family protein [Oceanospirillum multiglobuliferum]OPX54921.1 hypothetical protein BTE48_11960 [Oceanospirillum multiglobuliferum]SKA14297.1 Murein DD-endopeptidase MepM and murein hydrolase activator NlpD, contain LysM domain [Oceanospirillum multiglobuliferum]
MNSYRTKLLHTLFLTATAIVAALSMLIISQDVSAKRIEIDLPLNVSSSKHIEEPISNWPTLSDDWASYSIKSGETLTDLFVRAKLPLDDLYRLIYSPIKTDLSHLRPKQKIHVQTDHSGAIKAIRLDHSAQSVVLFSLAGEKFTEKPFFRETEKVLQYRQGSIKDSFFAAGENANLSQQSIMALANLFGWDIDFSLDTRPNDSFKVLYYQEFLDGEFFKDGDILAAEFINQGKSYRAVRYVDSKGNIDYFSPDGRNMRKQFLRSPVDFTRISSHFTTRRFHPVLHKFRSHRGTDYAASRGTPVKSTGSGKVITAGYNSSYGKHVVIQHGTRYTTLYAHLNGFAKGVRRGERVQQGQMIGYVGSTGLASGPHLHYEFRVNGIHKNPVTVQLPDVAPISDKERERFQQYTQNIIANLDSYPNIQLASLEKN